MGSFRSAARVGCLRGGATRLLEEWPPIPRFRGDGQNPAYRPSGNYLTQRRKDAKKECRKLLFALSCLRVKQFRRSHRAVTVTS